MRGVWRGVTGGLAKAAAALPPDNRSARQEARMPDPGPQPAREGRDSRHATVPGSAAGRRFDAVLAELFPEFSRSRLAAWIKSGDALLDGARARPRDPVHGGEAVTLHAEPEDQVRAEPEDIPLSILHEDAEVL